MPRPIVMPSLASKVASARLERSALRSNREGKPAETGNSAEDAAKAKAAACSVLVVCVVVRAGCVWGLCGKCK